eukprot:118259-Amorphochlora_amoeboformis.AAC.1
MANVNVSRASPKPNAPGRVVICLAGALAWASAGTLAFVKSGLDPRHTPHTPGQTTPNLPNFTAPNTNFLSNSPLRSPS